SFTGPVTEQVVAFLVVDGALKRARNVVVIVNRKSAGFRNHATEELLRVVNCVACGTQARSGSSAISALACRVSPANSYQPPRVNVINHRRGAIGEVSNSAQLLLDCDFALHILRTGNKAVGEEHYTLAAGQFLHSTHDEI